MNNPAISIIIPAYNAEKYIDQTLDSIFMQTFTDFECIVVNDGSSDGTLRLLQARISPKLKIISQANKGEYVARATGICAAIGEYLAFCDADDIVRSDWLEKLYNALVENKADIAVCGFSRINNSTGEVISTEMCWSGVLDTECYPQMSCSINPAVYNKLVKRELYVNINCVDQPPRLADDALLTLFAFIRSKRIVFIPEALYLYQVYDTSAIANVSIEDVWETTAAFANLIQKIGATRKTFLHMFTACACGFVMFCGGGGGRTWKLYEVSMDG